MRKRWRDKFAHALHGLRVGVQGHSSFFVHFFSTALVIATALAMGMSLLEWAILFGCVAAVLTAEMFNSALESLSRALGLDPDPHIRDALDIASAAVLLSALGAALVGALIFLRRLAMMMGWGG
jgi:diacylglycerol kinase